VWDGPPIMMEPQPNISDFLDSKTNLDWDNTPSNGIYSSGCSPLHDKNYSVQVTDSEVTLTIEPRTPGSCTCAIMSLLPILFPIVGSIMTANLNAKRLSFVETNGRVDFICRSKSALREDLPIRLFSVASVNTRSRAYDREFDQLETIDFIISHGNGVHRIEVDNDNKSVPAFVEAIQALLERVHRSRGKH
jgi:hypothetical protein